METAEDTKKVDMTIGPGDLEWTIKVFMVSATSAFFLGMLAYILTFLFAEPEPVSKAIVSTASAATSKVTVTSNYIDPMWAIFIFNSIAGACAVIGTGLFMMVHQLLINDIAMRPRNRIYAGLSVLMEKAMMPVYRALIGIAGMLDRNFPFMEKSGHKKIGTIWQYCGYGKDEYRMFSYMLPYTVPLLILMVNGILIGILLAFFTFNGAMTGFQLFGTKGIAIGLFYNVVYFFISIVPHGIIEIPMILVAAAVGYRFAYTQAHDVIENDLFIGDDIASLKNDVSKVNDSVKAYLLSSYTWKMLAMIVMTLLVAAYIETYVTLGVVDRVMTVLDSNLESLMAMV